MLFGVGAEDTTITWQRTKHSAATGALVENQSSILWNFQYLAETTLWTGEPGLCNDSVHILHPEFYTMSGSHFSNARFNKSAIRPASSRCAVTMPDPCRQTWQRDAESLASFAVCMPQL